MSQAAMLKLSKLMELRYASSIGQGLHEKGRNESDLAKKRLSFWEWWVIPIKHNFNDVIMSLCIILVM